MDSNTAHLSPAEVRERFPRSAAYPLDWIQAGGMGSHPLWMTEWLSESMHLQPGMRVLDLGCGRARSSIFMAREFEVQVWATDLWIPARDNWRDIRTAGLEQRVFPIHADARSLPFVPVAATRRPRCTSKVPSSICPAS